MLGVKSLRDVTPDQLEQGKGKMSEVVYRRARHVIGEIERTIHAAEGIRQSNWPTVGKLMYASHYSLRDDYEVSCKELDVVVEITEDIGYKGGVYGCRMTGGGFGGCCVALVKDERCGCHLEKDCGGLQGENWHQSQHLQFPPCVWRDDYQSVTSGRKVRRGHGCDVAIQKCGRFIMNNITA